jgi:hypothetical protein
MKRLLRGLERLWINLFAVVRYADAKTAAVYGGARDRCPDSRRSAGRQPATGWSLHKAFPFNELMKSCRLDVVDLVRVDIEGSDSRSSLGTFPR